MRIGKILAAILFGTFGFQAFALSTDNVATDPSSPDFVTASLLIISPGDTLYSCAGHACLRMECPAHKLDYCFSYESEDVKDRVLSFFAGKLKMGMFCVPTVDFLKQYKEEGRGVMQYKLNLPPAAKQKLWKILDDKVAEGANLPYDYIKRGCAQSIVAMLRDAVKPAQIEVSSWPERNRLTRREHWNTDRFIAYYPWNNFFINAIFGTEMDWTIPRMERIVMPNDVPIFLKLAKVYGQAIISDKEKVLLEMLPLKKPIWVSPLIVVWAAVLLAIINLFVRKTWLDNLFIAFQAVAGAFLMYLVFVSELPTTDWNWLVVPFNILPAVFWKWRRKWALAFVAILVVWEAGMIFYPHQLTLPAYLVLVSAYIIFYLKFTLKKPLCFRKESK